MLAELFQSGAFVVLELHRSVDIEGVMAMPDLITHSGNYETWNILLRDTSSPQPNTSAKVQLIIDALRSGQAVIHEHNLSITLDGATRMVCLKYKQPPPLTKVVKW